MWTPEILIRQRNRSRKELGSNFVQQNVRILEEQLEEEHNVEDYECGQAAGLEGAKEDLVVETTMVILFREKK